MDRVYNFQQKRYAPQQRSAPKQPSYPTYDRNQHFGPTVNKFEPTPDRKRSQLNQLPEYPRYPNTTAFESKQGGLKINYVNPGIRQTEDDSNATWGANRGGSQTELRNQGIPPSQADSVKKPRYIKKKNDGTVNTLKSELQNLKQEVSKLMSKQTTVIKKEKSGVIQKKMSSNSKDDSMKPVNSYYEKQSPFDALDSYQNQRNAKGSYYTPSNFDYLNAGKGSDRDISDTVSVTSERIIDEPLRKLSKKVSDMNYDHAHYLELENQLLKTELRNLKNKYNSKKTELNEKCDILQRKNQYLEIAFKKSEESLLEYKDALTNQIQNIRLQVARKYQSDMEHSNKKTDQFIKSFKNQAEKQTETDNQFVQEKLKKLYQQISEKNKLINTLNIEINQIKSDKQKLNFELKKQKQKNDQLFKQAELAKRELSRSQDYLEAQMKKRNDLTKNLQSYKLKNLQLLGQIDKSDRSPSNEFDSRLYEDINHYKQIQSELRIQIKQLGSKNKKLVQLQEADKLQIDHLKQNNEESMKQVQNLSKMLRSEKEKSLQSEEYMRKEIESLKKMHQQRTKLMRDQFEQRLAAQIDSVSVNVNPISSHQQKSQQKYKTEKQIEQADFQLKQIIKKKDMQIKKWKAEYKIIKSKIDQKEKIEKNKKIESDKYYQQYVDLKHRNRGLQAKNESLKKQIDEIAQKLKHFQVADAHFKTKLKKEGGKTEYQVTVFKKQCADLQAEIKKMEAKQQQIIQRYQSQVAHRKQIEQKIFNLDLEEQSELNQIIQKIQKRVNENDQKVNKYIKQIKVKDQTISKLKKQVRQLLENKESEVQQMKQKYMEQIANENIDKQLQYVQQMKRMVRQQTEIQNTKFIEVTKEAAQFKQKFNELEREVVHLRTQNRGLNRLYNDKLSEFENVQNIFNTQKEQYQQRLSQARMEKLQKQNILSNQFKFKSQEIQSLRDEVRRLNAFFTAKQASSSFDGALKQQIQTNQKMREEIKKKTEELFQVRDSYSSLRSQYDNLKSEVEIIKLKAISQKKNLQVNFDVQMQNLKNKMVLEQKKVCSLQQKMSLVVQQTKKKDSFIQTYIMGKKLPQNQKQFVTEFIKKYELQIGGSEKSINQILTNESSQIEKLSESNFSLLKQLTNMKEKMAAYEQQQVEDNDSPSKSSDSFASPKGSKSPSLMLSSKKKS